MSVNNFEDFLWTAYNSLPGAIGAENANSIKESATRALYAAGAKLFFDDYQTLGMENLNNGGINAIHVFNINGLYLPSSIFFNKIGEALINTEQVKKYMRVSIQLPSTLQAVEVGGGSDDEKKNKVVQAWQDQIKSAKKESNFHISFLSNFFGLISELIG